MKSKPRLQKRTYGGVRADLRIQERKEKILSAGLEAFGTIGYAKTSIKKICRLAGLTERYFYESFDNKEDLLSAVYRSITDELARNTLAIIDTPRKNPKVAAYEAIKRYYQTLQEDPRKARVLFFEILGVSQQIDREYQKAIHDLSNYVMTLLSMVSPTIDPQRLKKTILPAALSGATIQVASQWVLSGFAIPLEELLAQIMMLFEKVEIVFQDRTVP